MQKRLIRWILAILITISAAVYQRMTGPSYPLKGKIEIDGQEISYRLKRSHGGDGSQPVNLALKDTSFNVYLLYKRYKTADDWKKIPMQRSNEQLQGALPHQPPAGKLEYYLLLEKNDAQYSIPKETTVITRFKGAVPKSALIPHILFMFIGMLMSTLAGLEALFKGGKTLKYTLIACLTLFIGGMIFGPFVQKHAFDAYWTNFPISYDLTDNKLLIAMICWLTALWRVWKSKGKNARWWAVTAAVILLLVYFIPHSMMGSELDYEKMQIVTGD